VKMYWIMCGLYGFYILVISIGYMLVMSTFYGILYAWFSSCFDLGMNVKMYI